MDQPKAGPSWAYFAVLQWLSISNNGQRMWQKFVKKHMNIFMILWGHFSGEALLTSTGDQGTQVHQILSNYQGFNNGGESWLRYMIFQPEASAQ